MVTTIEIAPAPALVPFVRCYIFREFNTNGFDIKRPWLASQDVTLHFFFKALPIKLTHFLTGEILKTGKPTDIVGMSSQYNGDMHFKGAYSFLQVMFKPDGFTRLFKIPSSCIINRIACSDEFFNLEIKLLHEQLFHAKSPVKMASLIDAFLLSYAKKQKSANIKNAIGNALDLITKNAGFINIDVLARDANMSVRNFERMFTSATAMSPKLLCCITRFNKALELKLQNLNMDWTSVAHESGYYDQMHLIKEFKRFSGETPKTLLKDTFLFEEDYTVA